jgi:hypothetical protein
MPLAARAVSMCSMTDGGAAMNTGFEPVPVAVRAGDRLVVHAHRQGEPERDAEILEVLGTHGNPPYRVRWSDNDHETIVYPGSDVYIEHRSSARRRRRQEASR